MLGDSEEERTLRLEIASRYRVERVRRQPGGCVLEIDGREARDFRVLFEEEQNAFRTPPDEHDGLSEVGLLEPVTSTRSALRNLNLQSDRRPLRQLERSWVELVRNMRHTDERSKERSEEV